MARTLAIPGRATRFLRGSDPIAEKINVAWSDHGKDVIDVTNFDTDDGVREYIDGFRKGGSVLVGMVFHRDEYEDWVDDLENDTPVTYSMQVDDGNVSFGFNGFTRDIEVVASMDDYVALTVDIEITGRPETSVLVDLRYDNFTGEIDNTPLEDHTSDTGQSWIEVADNVSWPHVLRVLAAGEVLNETVPSFGYYKTVPDYDDPDYYILA